VSAEEPQLDGAELIRSRDESPWQREPVIIIVVLVGLVTLVIMADAVTDQVCGRIIDPFAVLVGGVAERHRTQHGRRSRLIPVAERDGARLEDLAMAGRPHAVALEVVKGGRGWCRVPAGGYAERVRESRRTLARQRGQALVTELVSHHDIALAKTRQPRQIRNLIAGEVSVRVANPFAVLVCWIAEGNGRDDQCVFLTELIGNRDDAREETTAANLLCSVALEVIKGGRGLGFS
jgi:hypothetical protein